MDIVQYLIELLKIRKEIGIEGLGTLYKKKTPGRYDAETHSFLPPSYVLKFSTTLTEDANLSEYIQNKRNISENSAQYFINEFVEKVKKALTEDGIYNLGDLGKFTEKGNEISFHPTHEINLGFDFFALPTVIASSPTTFQADEFVDDSISNQEAKEVSISEATALENDLTAHNVVEQETEAEQQNEETLALAEDEIAVDSEESVNETDTQQFSSNSEEIITKEHIVEEESDKEESALDIAEEEITIHNPLETENESSVAEESREEVAVAQEESSKSFETNEATQDEIYEEIGEVNSENPTAIVSAQQQETVTDNWDFDDENVISEEDIQEEKLPRNEFDKTFTNNSANPAQKKGSKKIKISTNANDWDFENVATGSLDDKPTDEFYDVDSQHLSEEETTQQRPLYQKIIIGILVLSVLVFGAYLYNPDLFSNLNRNESPNADQKIAIPLEDSRLKTQQDSLSFADSIMKNAEKSGLIVEPAKDTLKVTTKVIPVNTTTYEIIGAALAKSKDVEKYIANMKRNGLNAKVANMPGKIYKKISIASFTNIDSANKELKKLRLRLKNSDLYIFEDKNK